MTENSVGAAASMVLLPSTPAPALKFDGCVE